MRPTEIWMSSKSTRWGDWAGDIRQPILLWQTAVVEQWALTIIEC